MAHAFGACSPTTTCKNEMMATAVTEAIPPRERNSRLGGSDANQLRNRCATVSSATYPSRIEATVMPSWAAESWR
jgi:hypothetical protein